MDLASYPLVFEDTSFNLVPSGARDELTECTSTNLRGLSRLGIQLSDTDKRGSEVSRRLYAIMELSDT